VLFRAGRRIGRYPVRDGAESAPAPDDTTPPPDDTTPPPDDTTPPPEDRDLAPAGSVPAVTRTPRSWARRFSRPPVWGALVVALAFAAGFTVSPASDPSQDASNGIAPAVGAMRHLVSVPQSGQDFAGTPAVGALFTLSGGRLGSHFCTASVIDSPHGDLVITAAHCVSGAPGGLAFVPGYDAGAAPYGVWTVTEVYVDASWSASSDPDDDVAFLRVSQARSGEPIEDVTGAEQLGTGTPARQFVEVIGYPDSSDEAIACQNWTRQPMPDQLEFDCGGYTDGTSGGPFLDGVNPLTGQGTVIGVIGGYEQGGLTPEVSYSAVFGANVAALYQVAVAGG
jgi:V8-like Glu-specific endopeptidase